MQKIREASKGEGNREEAAIAKTGKLNNHKISTDFGERLFSSDVSITIASRKKFEASTKVPRKDSHASSTTDKLGRTFFFGNKKS